MSTLMQSSSLVCSATQQRGRTRCFPEASLKPQPLLQRHAAAFRAAPARVSRTALRVEANKRVQKKQQVCFLQPPCSRWHTAQQHSADSNRTWVPGLGR
jgi:hypothetical protein